MWPFKRKALVDNHGTTCVPLDQHIKHGGLTLVGSCSLCGAEIELWPCTETYCSYCLATVDHGAGLKPLAERGE